MRIRIIAVSFGLCAALLAGGWLLAPSFAGEGRTGERAWLSIGQVHEKLEAAGYRSVEKIEREHGVYEARATDSNGARLKLSINPQTGEVLSQKRKHDAPTSADCNKRRCRDDLPVAQSLTSTKP